MNLRILPPLLSSLILVGCGSERPEDRFAGVWTVDHRLTKLPDLAGFPFGGGGRDAKERLNRRVQGFAAQTRLKLRPTGRFVLAGPGAAEGKWTLAPKGDVVLTPDDPKRPTVEMTFDRKSERLTYAPPAGLITFSIVLRKSG